MKNIGKEKFKEKHKCDKSNFLTGSSMSRIQLLTSISHICQEICDIKSRRRPQSNLANRNYVNTGLDKELTNPKHTLEQGNSSSAKEGSDDGDGWDGTYSSRSKLHPPEPNNPYIPSHHAPTLS